MSTQTPSPVTRYLPVNRMNDDEGPDFAFATLAAMWIACRRDSAAWAVVPMILPEPDSRQRTRTEAETADNTAA